MSSGDPVIRVLILEDQVLMADALTRLIDAASGITVVKRVGRISDLRAYLGQMDDESTFDLALLDYDLPDGTGATAARMVKLAAPNARVLMLSIIEDDTTILECIRYGADGYVTKGEAFGAVVQGIRDCMAGETVAPRGLIDAVRRRVVTRPSADLVSLGRVPRLTTREVEVLRGFAEQKSRAEVARSTHMSEGTVRTHTYNLMRKLDVHTILHAVLQAQALGLLPPPTR